MANLRSVMRGGLRLPSLIEPPPVLPLRQMPFAPALFVALGRPESARSGLEVREGEEVLRGQILADPPGRPDAPVHAPATGRVVRIAEQGDGQGGMLTVLRLEPFSGDTQEVAMVARSAPVPAALAPTELLDQLRASGLVSQRGSVHARLVRARERGCKLLVINGIESEPVFERMASVLAGQSAEFVIGLACLEKMLGVESAMLAVEAHNAPAAHHLAAEVSRLKVHSLPPRYPQGEPELLVRVLATKDRRLATEPAALFGLDTVAEVGRLLGDGRPMTDQLVCLVGAALGHPGSYRVPLGTPLGFALAHAGLDPEPVRVLLGGPMRGQTVAALEMPIGKGMNCFTVMPEAQAVGTPAALACIRCGECVTVCPVGLQPAELGLLARRDELAAMHEVHYLDHCIECGCCAFVCPSHIPLVQQFRAAKRQWQRIRPPALGEAAA